MVNKEIYIHSEVTSIGVFCRAAVVGVSRGDIGFLGGSPAFSFGLSTPVYYITVRLYYLW